MSLMRDHVPSLVNLHIRDVAGRERAGASTSDSPGDVSSREGDPRDTLRGFELGREFSLEGIEPAFVSLHVVY